MWRGRQFRAGDLTTYQLSESSAVLCVAVALLVLVRHVEIYATQYQHINTVNSTLFILHFFSLTTMAGARPSRGARVVYREIDSDDSDYDYDDFTKVVLVDHLGDDDDSNDVDFRPNNSPIQEAAPAVS